ncbi:MAG: uroporphyrinogen-III synthase [Acidobacteriaceae bacterium]|nr:uroporphyrinogen-III synthase [Acidobacteriaceae bacterium]
MTALAGLRVVVTRTAHQAEELARPLRDHGASVILLPVIGIAPPADPEALRTAARSDAYQWIVFTSTNAVHAFAAERQRPVNARIATVGSATREAAEAHGYRVELVPERYIAESLLEALANEDLAGARILIPSAAVTRDVVAPALRKRGARVDVVEAYRNILPPEAHEQARSIFQPPHPDWVTLASSSAVTNLVQLAGVDVLKHIKLATIGPATSETVRGCGLTVAAEGRVHTVEGLVDAIVEHASGTLTAGN